MQTIKLSAFGIVLELDGKGAGTIKSDLHCEMPNSGAFPPEFDDEKGYDLYEAAMDVIESIVLAHACAGIDVTSPAYLEGIETVFDATSNNLQ